jgi:hypothetical protein
MDAGRSLAIGRSRTPMGRHAGRNAAGGFVAYAYFKPHSPLRPVAFQAQRQQLTEQPVHTMLLGPRRLQSQPANHLAVMTRSLVGDARSTPVAYRWYGEGDRLLAEAEAHRYGAGSYSSRHRPRWSTGWCGWRSGRRAIRSAHRSRTRLSSIRPNWSRI